MEIGDRRIIIRLVQTEPFCDGNVFRLNAIDRSSTPESFVLPPTLSAPPLVKVSQKKRLTVSWPRTSPTHCAASSIPSKRLPLSRILRLSPTFNPRYAAQLSETQTRITLRFAPLWRSLPSFSTPVPIFTQTQGFSEWPKQCPS